MRLEEDRRQINSFLSFFFPLPTCSHLPQWAGGSEDVGYKLSSLCHLGELRRKSVLGNLYFKLPGQNSRNEPLSLHRMTFLHTGIDRSPQERTLHFRVLFHVGAAWAAVMLAVSRDTYMLDAPDTMISANTSAKKMLSHHPPASAQPSRRPRLTPGSHRLKVKNL